MGSNPTPSSRNASNGALPSRESRCTIFSRICVLDARPAQAWTAFATLGTTQLYADPACAFLTTGQAVCAARTLKHTLVVNRFTGVAWTGWLDRGGAISSKPSCTGNGTGRAFCIATGTAGKPACFARGTDSTLWGNRFARLYLERVILVRMGSLGGLIDPRGSCVRTASASLVCTAIALVDSAFWSNSYNGTSWLGWTRFGGLAIANPACASLNIRSECLTLRPAA